MPDWSRRSLGEGGECSHRTKPEQPTDFLPQVLIQDTKFFKRASGFAATRAAVSSRRSKILWSVAVE